MKKFYASLLSAILLIYFSSCKKESVTPIDFSTITVTDSSCLFVGAIDNTDWINDTIWTTAENALVNFAPNVVTADSLTGYIVISPPCPNPSDGHFNIGINAERECKMKIACVNTEMETLYFTTKKLSAGPNTVSLDLTSNTGFHKNENYRMYYAFYNSNDTVYYKGHGDFRIE